MPRRRTSSTRAERSWRRPSFEEAQAQQHRHHEVVRDHGAQGHGLDDHHGGRGREPAQEGRERQPVAAGGERQGQDEEVGIGRVEPADAAGQRDRQHEEVDDQQVERQQPAGPAEMVALEVLDHRDLELARQDEEGGAGEEGREEEVGIAARRPADPPEAAIARQGGTPEDVARPVEQDEGHDHAHEKKTEELDEALQRHGQHHALVVLGRVDVAGAEQDAEGGEHDGDEEGGVGADRGDPARHRPVAQHDLHAEPDRLELEGDVGDDPDDRHDRDEAAQEPALAVAGRDEVGDRGDAVGLGDREDLAQHEGEEQRHQGRAEIDRQEAQAGRRRDADAAVEGPGGAVDGERERVDEGAPDHRAALVGAAVAERGGGEEGHQIGRAENQGRDGEGHGG